MEVTKVEVVPSFKVAVSDSLARALRTSTKYTFRIRLDRNVRETIGINALPDTSRDLNKKLIPGYNLKNNLKEMGKMETFLSESSCKIIYSNLNLRYYSAFDDIVIGVEFFLKEIDDSK